MKLSKLRLRNFRCFKDEISIDFDDITVLVGKNDSGKSTLMEALDIFLNENVPDKDDASKDGTPEDLTIICKFSDLPEEIVIDDAYPTNLKTEFLLNSQGLLEIHKKYSGNLKNPKCESIEACALHPTVEGARDLLQLKNPDLKKRASDLGVNLDGIDQKINAQIRRCIRESFSDLDVEESMIPLNDDNAKKIWIELRKYLPAFALFKSDRISTDQDPEAQDPLKAAIKEAIKEKETELTEITEFVRREVEKIANSTLEKLHEMDSSLATQLNPIFSSPRWDSIFKASITSDDDIPINKRGSGVKRLILLNFFRAKAEEIAKEKKQADLIYAIEEPETSQHPNNQLILLRALSELSSETQVIISTHTPMLARGLPDKSLRYIKMCDDNTREILKGGPETNNIFTIALGVLPDNSVKLFIGVEGQNDISFLQNISKVLCQECQDVIDLEKLERRGEIIFFPLGGSNLALWSCRLEKLNRPEFHLCDRDNPPPKEPKYKEHVDEVNLREKCKAKHTSKKEIENYLHKDAIINAYREKAGIELSIDENFNEFDDVANRIAQLVHEASDSQKDWNDLAEDQVSKKESNVKKFLCYHASKYMNLEMLNEIDPDGDLIEWFQDMKNLMELA